MTATLTFVNVVVEQVPGAEHLRLPGALPEAEPAAPEQHRPCAALCSAQARPPTRRDLRGLRPGGGALRVGRVGAPGSKREPRAFRRFSRIHQRLARPGRGHRPGRRPGRRPSPVVPVHRPLPTIGGGGSERAREPGSGADIGHDPRGRAPRREPLERRPRPPSGRAPGRVGARGARGPLQPPARRAAPRPRDPRGRCSSPPALPRWPRRPVGRSATPPPAAAIRQGRRRVRDAAERAKKHTHAGASSLRASLCPNAAATGCVLLRNGLSRKARHKKVESIQCKTASAPLTFC